jgi:hypothetical protein
MELELWHALTDEIERAFDLPRTSPPWEEDFHLGGLLELAVHRAAARVAGEHEPDWSPDEIDVRLSFALESMRRSVAARESGRRPLGRSRLVGRLRAATVN